MKIVNATPHALNFVDFAGNSVLELPPSGLLARCRSVRRNIGALEVEGVAVPLTETSFGALEGLPPPQDGVLYVVSAIAAQAAKAVGRTDVLLPDDAVRDSAGCIIGVRALARP